MNKIPVSIDILQAGSIAPANLIDGDGEILIPHDQTITEENIENLKNKNELFYSLQTFGAQIVEYQSIDTKISKPNFEKNYFIETKQSSLSIYQLFPCNLVDKQSNVILDKGNVIDETIYQSLEGERLFFDLNCINTTLLFPPDSFQPDANKFVFKATFAEKQRTISRMEHLVNGKLVEGAPEKPAFAESIYQIKYSDRDDKYKKNFEGLYHKLVIDIRDLYLMIYKGMDQSALQGKKIIQTIMDKYRYDSTMMLNICNYNYTDNNFLFSHSLKATIFSISISCAMGYSEDQISKIALGALTSDVGMLSVSEEIRIQATALDNESLLDIREHPLNSAIMIGKLNDFEPIVQLVTYQINERENGKGYPLSRNQAHIHPFSKIAAVADVYAAMISPRSYRKAMKPNTAIREVAMMGRQGLLNLSVIKSFMQAVSIFPIGSILHLNNNAIGRVVITDPEAPNAPTVSIFIGENGKALPKENFYLLDLKKRADVKVEKVLDNSFIKGQYMLGF